MDLRRSVIESPIKHGRKAAIMRKFIKEEAQRNKMLLIDSKKNVLPDLSSCFSDSSGSDDHDVLFIHEVKETEPTNETIVINENEPILNEEEIPKQLIENSKIQVIDDDNDDQSYNRLYPKFEPKVLFKTTLLLHTIKNHAIENEGHNQKCDVCTLPKDSLEMDVKRLLTPNKSRLQCPVCSRKFLRKTGLNKHLQGHIDDHKKCTAQQNKREIISNLKNQRFLNMAALGSLPFECSKCQLPFAEEYDKRAHEELCRRRQYTHLWNFTDAKYYMPRLDVLKRIKAKDANTINKPKDIKNVDTVDENIDTKEAEIIVDVNMKNQANEESLWRPWS